MFFWHLQITSIFGGKIMKVFDYCFLHRWTENNLLSYDKKKFLASRKIADLALF